MNYQPFLIAPFATGLDTDIDPWMLPHEAFSDIVNGRIDHGVVVKRNGYLRRAVLVHQHQTNWKITNIVVLGVAPFTVTITMTNVTGLVAGNMIEIRHVTGMTQLNDCRYYVTNVVGGVGGTFDLLNVDGSSFTPFVLGGDVYLIPHNPVMGLERYIDSGNIKEVIAFDSKRACKYDPANENFTPVDSADIMGCGDSDFIHVANWASTVDSASTTLYRMYFTNGLEIAAGLNGIRYYNGGVTTTLFNPSINGVNTLDGCKMLFAWKQRLFCLATYEGGVLYPQRARWCEAQNPDGVDAWYDSIRGKGNFMDAPTGDHIISAQFVHDYIIVFFTNSVWYISYTGNQNSPFKWNKIDNSRSCDGKMASVQYDKSTISIGIRGIVQCDGSSVKRIDDRITDFVGDEINNAKFPLMFLKRDFNNKTTWILYPSQESLVNDSSLILDETSKSFSKYMLPMNVLGYAGASKDAAIDNFADQAIDEFGDMTIADFFYDDGAEFLIGGDVEGVVYAMEYGSDDDLYIDWYDITAVTIGPPCRITMTGDVGIVDGDIISISGVVGVTGINDQEWIVSNKVGNTFELTGAVAAGAWVSDGRVYVYQSDPIDMTIKSASWNPWIKEGKKCQLGYIDFRIDTNKTTDMTVEFYINDEVSPYLSKRVNFLPDLTEICTLSNITNASPGVVVANDHGLSTGDSIYIYDVEGMDDVNGGPYTVTVINGNSFSIGTDTTTYDSYVNGGVITEKPFYTDKAWKRIYVGGTGFEHRIIIKSTGDNKPLRIHAFLPWFKPVGSRPI